MLASTATVRTGDHLRLSLERGVENRLGAIATGVLTGSWIDADRRARELYQGVLSGRTDMMPYAAPTKAVSGVWVQDVRVKTQRSVRELIGQLDDLGVNVRDFELLGASQVNQTTAPASRETQTRKEGAEAAESGIFSQLGDVLTTARNVFLLLLVVVGVVWAWPFLWPLIRGAKKRLSKT